MKIIIYLVVAVCLVIGNAASLHAAPGDVKADCQSIAASGTLTIQPAASEMWLVSNIMFADNVTVRRTDGTDTVDFISFIGPDYHFFYPPLNLTNGNWLVIVNNGASAKIICYDGSQVK